MGLYESTYWITWFLSHALIGVISALIATSVGKMTSIQVFVSNSLLSYLLECVLITDYEVYPPKKNNNNLLVSLYSFLLKQVLGSSLLHSCFSIGPSIQWHFSFLHLLCNHGNDL